MTSSLYDLCLGDRRVTKKITEIYSIAIFYKFKKFSKFGLITETRYYESGIMSNRKSLRFGELSTEIAYTPPVTHRELGLALSLVDLLSLYVYKF